MLSDEAQQQLLHMLQRAINKPAATERGVQGPEDGPESGERERRDDSSPAAPRRSEASPQNASLSLDVIARKTFIWSPIAHGPAGADEEEEEEEEEEGWRGAKGVNR
ncbi:hypothetical protein EYF80_059552 [Liparis tanakae]|uniref:Uncharacterized protein n=1 Tax=Liparis tanakae TaxID=230148 RepID=A0A4Z2ENX5_9TELE|nr:hypothetical protein EYF80_059552 [Liparis tanakae]